MIQVSIEDSSQGFRHLVSQLSAKNMNIANVRAINKGIAKGNTEYKRGISRFYNIKQSDFKDKIVQKKATYSKIEGTISGTHAPISLSRFNPTFVKGGQVHSIKKGKDGLERKSKKAGKKAVEGGGVSFEISKGNKQTLSFAFMTNSEKNAGVEKQIFARGKYSLNKLVRQKERYPLVAIKTLSPFGAMTKTEVSKEVQKGASETMIKEFQRQVQLMLRK